MRESRLPMDGPRMSPLTQTQIKKRCLQLICKSRQIEQKYRVRTHTHSRHGGPVTVRNHICRKTKRHGPSQRALIQFKLQKQGLSERLLQSLWLEKNHSATAMKKFSRIFHFPRLLHMLYTARCWSDFNLFKTPMYYRFGLM